MQERFKGLDPTARWSARLALCSALVVSLPAWAQDALQNPVLGGSGAGIGDVLEYNSGLSTLPPCNTANPPLTTPFCTFPNTGPVATLSELLEGDYPPPLGAAGGNVELFASSEMLTLDEYIAYTGVTTLSGTLDGVPVAVSSLTWADWEVESYNCTSGTATALPGGLLDRWYTDLLTYLSGVSPLFVPPDRSEALGNMICGNFLQGFSDPNISYVFDGKPGDDMADAVIGLAGTWDLCRTLSNIFGNPPVVQGFCALPAVPGIPITGQRPPIQISEIVKVEAGGLSTILYNFNAAISGQSEVTDGPFYQSHTGIYEQLAPFDPPTGEKIGVVTGESGPRPIVEWTMTWVNGAEQDRYVRIFDRLTDGEYYDTEGTVTCTLTTAAGAPVSATPIPTNLRYGDPDAAAQKEGSCRFDAVLDGILFEGVIPGIANPNYGNTVAITFQYLPDDPQVEFPIENTVCTTWDDSGDGNLDTVPVCLQGFAERPTPPGPPTAIPVMQPFGLALMSVGLLIAAAWSRRRR